jgi:hypothetical protein
LLSENKALKIIVIILAVLAAINTAKLRAAGIDLSVCLDPLVLTSSFENPYDCVQTQVPYNSKLEFLARLGDPDPIGFCIGSQSGTGYTACTDVCSIELQSGCYGTLKADELILNPTNNRICGNYSVEVADIDVHTFGLSCTLSLIGTGGMVSELEATYPSPLTWQINANNSQFANVELEFSGCGVLGPTFDLLVSILSGLIENLLAEQVKDALTVDGGLRICPVDSLHPDFIPARP